VESHRDSANGSVRQTSPNLAVQISLTYLPEPHPRHDGLLPVLELQTKGLSSPQDTSPLSSGLADISRLRPIWTSYHNGFLPSFPSPCSITCQVQLLWVALFIVLRTTSSALESGVSGFKLLLPRRSNYLAGSGTTNAAVARSISYSVSSRVRDDDQMYK
jgi:hypothetical protein